MEKLVFFQALLLVGFLTFQAGVARATTVTPPTLSLIPVGMITGFGKANLDILEWNYAPGYTFVEYEATSGAPVLYAASSSDLSAVRETNVNNNYTYYLYLKNLSPSTTYSFYVEAKDSHGNYSAPSNTLTFTTPLVYNDTMPPTVSLGATVPPATFPVTYGNSATSNYTVYIQPMSFLRLPSSNTYIVSVSDNSATGPVLSNPASLLILSKSAIVATNAQAISNPFSQTTWQSSGIAGVSLVQLKDNGVPVLLVPSVSSTSVSATIIDPDITDANGKLLDSSGAFYESGVQTYQYSVTLPFAPVKNHTYDFFIKATDTSGNSTTTDITVLNDAIVTSTTPPPVTTAPTGPAVTSFSPSHASYGASVTVAGTSLYSNGNPGTMIFYNSNGSVAANYSNLYLNGSSLYFTVPSIAAGTYSVADYTSSILSNKLSFTVDAATTPVSAVILSSLSPTSGPVGTNVTVSGTNISGQSRFFINNGAGSQVASYIMPYMNGQSATIYIPTLAAGNYSITATGGNGVSSNSLSFTVTAPTNPVPPSNPSAPVSLVPTAPGLSSVSPTHGQAGATLTLTGSNFLNSASNIVLIYDSSGRAVWNINNLAPGSNGATLSFAIPALNAGNYTVAAMLSGQAPGNRISFTIDPASNPAPVITQGPLPCSGCRTTIIGTGFTATGNTVTVNGVNVGSLPSVYGGGSIIFNMPTLAPGTYPITVSNSNGTSAAFSVTIPVPPPAVVISSVSPASGPLGTTVTLTGSGFDAQSNQVTLEAGNGQIGNLNIASPNGTTLTFTIPTQYSVSGTVSIDVTNNTTGQDGTATFSITAPPTTSYSGTSNDASGWEAVAALCTTTHWPMCSGY